MATLASHAPPPASLAYAAPPPSLTSPSHPLPSPLQTKGKAAIDVICNPLGKSGGALIQQFMIIGFGSLAASTPYLGLILLAIVGMWIYAAKVRQCAAGFRGVAVCIAAGWPAGACAWKPTRFPP